MSDEKGFTLIEMIVVLAILGILLGIAAISGRDWLDRYRVEGQIKQMYADLMNARVSAMQRNRVFFVTLGTNQYAVYEDTYSAATGTSSPDGDGALQQGTGQDRPVMQKTTQYTLNFSAANFYFTQSGLVSLSSGGTIWVTSTASPASDCIALATTRILMGKMNGSNCIAQ
jgi:prepilin-type N-terminal cleavage/methylation domain-containing protein